MSQLTHLNSIGEANMVDVADKPITTRTARAEAFIRMQPQTLAMIQQGSHAKGDVLAVARVAGIQGAKKCSDLIPLCHPLALTKVAVDFDLQEQGIKVLCYCKLAGQTGVEMEALTAASVAALTLFDMCKAVDKKMKIEGLAVVEKTGGQSGDWQQEGMSC